MEVKFKAGGSRLFEQLSRKMRGRFSEENKLVFEGYFFVLKCQEMK